MASAQQLQGLTVGSILWIPKKIDPRVQELCDLPDGCLKHPCVVMSREGRAEQLVQVCVITSRHGQDINDSALPHRIRDRYLPIYPRPCNDTMPGQHLRLADKARLRKPSYVNTGEIYTLPLSSLTLYQANVPVNHYRLDAPSISFLRRKLSGKLTKVNKPSISTLTTTTTTTPTITTTTTTPTPDPVDLAYLALVSAGTFVSHQLARLAGEMWHHAVAAVPTVMGVRHIHNHVSTKAADMVKGIAGVAHLAS